MSKISKFAVMAIVVISLLTSTSCTINDIYTLVERIINGGEPTSFNIEAKINIDKEYLLRNQIIFEMSPETTSVPSEILLKLSGTIENEKNFYINVQIEDEKNLSTDIYRKDDKVYVKINEAVYVATNFIKALYIADPTQVRLFEDELVSDKKLNSDSDSDEEKYLCFDVGDFKLEDLEKYLNYLDEFLSVKTIRNEYSKIEKTIEFPESLSSSETIIHYDDLILNIQKNLMKLKGYRYEMLHVVLSNDDKKTFIDVAAIKEIGDTTILDTVEMDISIKNLKREHSEVLERDIIPFRYIFEILGYEVQYNKDEKRAYFINDEGKEEYVSGTIKNGRTYISLIQLMTVNMDIDIVNVGESIELSIYR